MFKFFCGGCGLASTGLFQSFLVFPTKAKSYQTKPNRPAWRCRQAETYSTVPTWPPSESGIPIVFADFFTWQLWV